MYIAKAENYKDRLIQEKTFIKRKASEIERFPRN